MSEKSYKDQIMWTLMFNFLCQQIALHSSMDGINKSRKDIIDMLIKNNYPMNEIEPIVDLCINQIKKFIELIELQEKTRKTKMNEETINKK